MPRSSTSRLRRISFRRDFLAGVAGGVVDFAEAAVAHARA